MARISTRSTVLTAAGIVTAAWLVIVANWPHLHSDFWLVALPGYLTGAGTIGLAALTYTLTRDEEASREQTTEALRISTIAANEASRQRRDARASKVAVTIVRGPYLGVVDEDGSPSYIYSRDAVCGPGQALLTEIVYLELRLLSEQRVTARVFGANIGAHPLGPPDMVGTTYDLEPGRPTLVAIQMTQAITIPDGESGPYGDRPSPHVEVDDGFDDGVRDRIDLLVSGQMFILDQALLASSNRSSTRRVGTVDTARLYVRVKPVFRTYFISKGRDLPLQ